MTVLSETPGEVVDRSVLKLSGRFVDAVRLNSGGRGPLRLLKLNKNFTLHPCGSRESMA